MTIQDCISFLKEYEDTIYIDKKLPDGKEKEIVEILTHFIKDPEVDLEPYIKEFMMRAICYKYDYSPYYRTYWNHTKIMFLKFYIEDQEEDFPGLIELIEGAQKSNNLISTNEYIYGSAIAAMREFVQDTDFIKRFREDVMSDEFLLHNLLNNTGLKDTEEVQYELR